MQRSIAEQMQNESAGRGVVIRLRPLCGLSAGLAEWNKLPEAALGNLVRPPRELELARITKMQRLCP